MPGLGRDRAEPELGEQRVRRRQQLGQPGDVRRLRLGHPSDIAYSSPGASAGPSMKETPFPFTVSAMIDLRQVRHVVERAERPLERRDVVAVAARHVPAERAELRLEVAEVADVLHPGVRLNLVVIDDRDDLAQSAIRGRRSDSQNCPSCSSPSPVSTKTRRSMPASRLASTMPFAFEMPMPSEPVLAWMYGVSTCGWPGSPCSRRS